MTVQAVAPNCSASTAIPSAHVLLAPAMQPMPGPCAPGERTTQPTDERVVAAHVAVCRADLGLKSEILLGLEPPGVGRLVEALVVETADIGDQSHLDRLRRGGRRRGAAGGARAACATPAATCRDNRDRKKCEREGPLHE